MNLCVVVHLHVWGLNLVVLIILKLLGPAFDLQVVTRVLSVTIWNEAHLNSNIIPAISIHLKVLVAQFDVPEDAWFFKANSSDDLMPYKF